MHRIPATNKLMQDDVCSRGGDVEHDLAGLVLLLSFAEAVLLAPPTAPDFFPPQHEDFLCGTVAAGIGGTASVDRPAAVASEDDLRSPPWAGGPSLLLGDGSAPGPLRPSEPAPEAQQAAGAGGEGREDRGGEEEVVPADRSSSTAAGGTAEDVAGIGPLSASDDAPGASHGSPPLLPLSFFGAPAVGGGKKDVGDGGGCISSEGGKGDSDGDLSGGASEKRFPG